MRPRLNAQTTHHVPLGGDVDDEDDLALELLKVERLAVRQLGLELVKLGHVRCRSTVERGGCEGGGEGSEGGWGSGAGVAAVIYVRGANGSGRSEYADGCEELGSMDGARPHGREPAEARRAARASVSPPAREMPAVTPPLASAPSDADTRALTLSCFSATSVLRTCYATLERQQREQRRALPHHLAEPPPHRPQPWEAQLERESLDDGRVCVRLAKQHDVKSVGAQPNP